MSHTEQLLKDIKNELERLNLIVKILYKSLVDKYTKYNHIKVTLSEIGGYPNMRLISSAIP